MERVKIPFSEARKWAWNVCREEILGFSSLTYAVEEDGVRYGVMCGEWIKGRANDLTYPEPMTRMRCHMAVLPQFPDRDTWKRCMREIYLGVYDEADVLEGGGALEDVEHRLVQRKFALNCQNYRIYTDDAEYGKPCWQAWMYKQDYLDFLNSPEYEAT